MLIMEKEIQQYKLNEFWSVIGLVFGGLRLNGICVFNGGPAIGPAPAHIFVANMVGLTVGIAARFKHCYLFRT